MVKKLVPVIALLAVLGGAYKFVLAKPAAAEKPKPHVEGTIYMLQKEFLVNLADGRFAKMQIGLILAHDDHSTEAAGGHGAPTPPEGYGAMTQEGVVRDVITNVLTGAKDEDLITEEGRETVKKKLLKALKKKTDAKVEEILFSDLTVQ